MQADSKNVFHSIALLAGAIYPLSQELELKHLLGASWEVGRVISSQIIWFRRNTRMINIAARRIN
jgi:hypothetical protein